MKTLFALNKYKMFTSYLNILFFNFKGLFILSLIVYVFFKIFVCCGFILVIELSFSLLNVVQICIYSIAHQV